MMHRYATDYPEQFSSKPKIQKFYYSYENNIKSKRILLSIIFMKQNKREYNSINMYEFSSFLKCYIFL